MMPVVSIIIPVFNSSQYLCDCLNSVCNQSYKDIEIIVVNDSSTDNSKSLIDKYINEHKDVSIKLFDLPINVGISAARNQGLKVATGKYIYLLDSDDDITVNCLSEMVDIAETDNLSLVLGENYIISDTEKYVLRVKMEKDRLYNNEILDTFTLRLWHNQPWNKLILRNVIEDNCLYFAEGHILEDELWSFQIASKIKSMGIVRNPTYNYYIRKGSTLNSILENRKRWDEFLCINSLLQSYIINNNLEDNMFVSKYYLTNLLVNIQGFEFCKSLDYKMFNRIIEINYIDISLLYKHKLLSVREYISYLYFNLPNRIGYFYYLSMRFILSLKKTIC